MRSSSPFSCRGFDAATKLPQYLTEILRGSELDPVLLGQRGCRAAVFSSSALPKQGNENLVGGFRPLFVSIHI